MIMRDGFNAKERFTPAQRFRIIDQRNSLLSMEVSFFTACPWPMRLIRFRRIKKDIPMLFYIQFFRNAVP